jgi:hypothetical protein
MCQHSHHSPFPFRVPELVNYFLCTFENTRNAALGFLHDASFVSCKFVSNDGWNNQRDRAVFHQLLQHPEGGLQLLVFGYVEPDARIDEQIDHRRVLILPAGLHNLNNQGDMFQKG